MSFKLSLRFWLKHCIESRCEVSVCPFPGPTEMSELVGKPAPDFEVELEDGSKKKLSEFLAEGKPVVIDFYANF